MTVSWYHDKYSTSVTSCQQSDMFAECDMILNDYAYVCVHRVCVCIQCDNGSQMVF